MPSTIDKMEQYLQLSRQSRREILAGAAIYGPSYILDERVPKALVEKGKSYGFLILLMVKISV
jgi:hypothetical protein